MNRKIGMVSSVINFGAILGFAVSMMIGFDHGSYLFSMFIAFSFVPMMCAYAYFSRKEKKLAGYISATFAAIYATIILLVYFAQLTTVRLNELTQQAAVLLDFQQFGLFFNYDLLGYALMALSTFFAGLTINAHNKVEKWLKHLLIIHGVFFISCLIVPILGVFIAANQPLTGIVLLEFWCLYFSPISVLSFMHFSKI